MRRPGTAHQMLPSRIKVPGRCGRSPRAHRAWPSAWPSPSGPQGRQRSSRTRAGPEDAFCGAGFAERLERIFKCPRARRGRSVQCAAFRPGASNLSPCDRRTCARRSARPPRSARSYTALREVGLRRGAGNGAAAAARAGALSRNRQRARRPTCGKTPRHLSRSQARHSPGGSTPLRACLADAASMARPIGWRAEGAPKGSSHQIGQHPFVLRRMMQPHL